MARSHSNNHDASRNPSSDKPSPRDRMSQDLQLRGLADRTHAGYLREVRKLAAYYHLPPDQLSEQQVGEYLPHLINDCNFAPGSLGVAYSVIKFFHTVTEPRDWNVLKKLRRPKQKTLPAVLTIDEVHRLIGAVRQHRNAAYFWTVYSLGLRLYGNRMPVEHRRVLAAITRCRTGELGHMRYDCRGCRRSHWVGRSCGGWCAPTSASATRHCLMAAARQFASWRRDLALSALTGWGSSPRCTPGDGTRWSTIRMFTSSFPAVA